MQNHNLNYHWVLTVIAAVAVVFTATSVVAQQADLPWMNSTLSPEQRADMVLKQMTLEEKLALLHGNGMGHAPQWQMPLFFHGKAAAGFLDVSLRLGLPL